MFGACADRLLYAAQKHVTSHYFPQSRNLTYFKYETNDSYTTIPSSIIRNNKHISVLLSWRSVILCKFIQNFPKLQYKYTQLHWSAIFSLGLGNLETANFDPCFFIHSLLSQQCLQLCCTNDECSANPQSCQKHDNLTLDIK